VQGALVRGESASVAWVNTFSRVESFWGHPWLAGLGLGAIALRKSAEGLRQPVAMASPVLFRRWQALDDRALWLLLAALLAVDGLVLALLTQ
jgi:hypothetical protein